MNMESTNNYFDDNFDKTWIKITRLPKSRLGKRYITLNRFIVVNGGIDDSSGEVLARGIKSGQPGTQIGLLRKKNKPHKRKSNGPEAKSLLEMTELAFNASYLKDNDPEELVTGIISETYGEPFRTPWWHMRLGV